MYKDYLEYKKVFGFFYFIYDFPKF